MSDIVEYKINSYKKQATLPNGGSYFTVKGNSIDKEQCSIALIGKNMPNYGETQSENYLHLMQHFCSGKTNAPGVDEPAVKGQLWYEEVEGGSYNLNICTQGGIGNVVKWDKISHVIVSNSEPSSNISQTGDLWYNIDTNSLMVYDKTLNKWICIGPQYYEHKKYDSQDITINDGNTLGTITINNSLYLGTVKNSSESSLYHYGCCALMTSKIIMKENLDDLKHEGNLPTQKCKAIIVKYLVQSMNGINCKIIGNPTYEVIAQGDREGSSADDWNVSIGLNDNETKIEVSINAKPHPGYHTTIECYTEAERV